MAVANAMMNSNVNCQAADYTAVDVDANCQWEMFKSAKYYYIVMTMVVSPIYRLSMLPMLEQAILSTFEVRAVPLLHR